MTSHVARNWESGGVKGDFKFTDTGSFRLFVEGMTGLRRYEQSAAQEGLQTAETKLAKCVVQYPHDVLPKFYLGVVKVFRGYDGLDDAIRIFDSIIRDVPELRAAAMYNLATAHIERYTPDSLDLARQWLEKCIKEVGKDKSVDRITLRLQARVLLLFYEIRQRLWVKRRCLPDTLKEEIEHTVPELERRLDEFLKQLPAPTRIPEAARADIMADYWNDRGILEEFKAWTALDEEEKTKLARASIQSYEESLKWKLNWVPPTSNMARVYMDLLEDFDHAMKCWEEVKQARPGDEYAEYMLGRLFEKQGDSEAAISHYEQAPHIPEAGKQMGKLFEDLGRRDEAVATWSEILAHYPEDKEALEAHERLGSPAPTPASDAKLSV